MKKKVLIAAPVHPVITDGLEAAGYALKPAPGITQQSAPALMADCTGVVTSTRLQLDKALIDAAPHLRWIGRMGSGMEVIDVAYAAAKGIACYSSPEGNSNAVAEHALGLLLALNKRIAVSAAEVQQGIWLREENRGTEIEGKTVGIIGFGHTGRAFARVLQGFGARILAYDVMPKRDVPPYVQLSARPEPIYAGADIVSFHVPISGDTHHYLDRAFIGRMQRPFVVINTSRGEVMSSADLEWGLGEGKIRGACIDVWEGEPLPKMPAGERERLLRLSAMPQVIITPHIAGYTQEALYKMSRVLLDKIVPAGNS